MVLRMKNVQLLIFHTPPLQNHHFWVPMEAKMEPQWRLEPIFIESENDDRNAMPCRELLETFLHLEPPLEERRFPPWDRTWDPVYI